MLRRFGDFDRTFTVFDELRRSMDRVWDDYETDAIPSTSVAVSWPKFSIADAGQNLVLKADMPGMSEKELQLTLSTDSLSIAGERKVDAPEGYSVHRQERSGAKFSRSFALPCRVDAERTSAVVKDGVLTITLAKAAEAQPRQIAIRAQ
jgi:HSP20 family protein